MEEKDERMLAENLIKSLEKTYFDLRKKHPDKDEHWFLANTWLKKYGSGEEAKEKGAEWAKFTAYKETHQFSILEPPESIRGLALILVYTKLGEQQAKHYESEFSRIMDQTMKSRINHVFLDEYKKRNPLTWKEVQVVDNSSYSLYWFFKQLEFEQGRDEDILDERDILDKILDEEKGEIEKENPKIEKENPDEDPRNKNDIIDKLLEKEETSGY